MATQQGMSGIDVLAMISELDACMPLWIGKIYQYDTKTLGIRLNGENKARYNFMAEAGRRAHCTAEFPPAPPNPSGFSMLLRKYLSGGKVLSIRQHGLQRIFEIEIGKKDTSYHLVFELFDEGNVVLCDHDYIIIKPLWHHRFREREVVPGAVYQFPGPGELHMGMERMADILASSDRDLVRTLAVDGMLGGRYAEEVCRIADIKGTTAGAIAAPDKVYEAYEELLHLVIAQRQPVITASGCWPMLLDDEEPIERFETFQEALDAYYPRTRKEIKEEKPRISREELIRRRQKDAIQKFEQKIEALEKKVETIYAHYPLVSDIIETLDRVSREKSWQEIEEIIEKSDNTVAKTVTGVYPDKSAVDLMLDVKVTIFVHESVEANIGRYYDQIKKFKRKKTGALKAMEQPVAKKVPKKKDYTPLKSRWYHRFRWSYTSDGILMIGGRDASQNEELVKRYMEGGDRFVHADVHGGSVVIVKGETEYWDEAAQYAASYSNAWKSGHFTADVYAVEREQVSKTPESGEYVARGSFIIRGERRYFRDVPLGIAIGLQLEPAAAVIGGPVTAVKKRAYRYIILKPGQFNPNDIAKKVLRRLREQLFEEELKGLKNILNTEKIAAFVPPGGSDIVEDHES